MYIKEFWNVFCTNLFQFSLFSESCTSLHLNAKKGRFPVYSQGRPHGDGITKKTKEGEISSFWIAWKEKLIEHLLLFMTKFVYYEMTVWCPNVKEEVEKAPSNSKPVLIHEFEIMKCMKFLAKCIFATKDTSQCGNFMILLSLRLL